MGNAGTGRAATPSPADVVSLVEAARTAILIRLTPQPVAAGAAAAVLMGFMLWPTSSRHLELAAWLACRLALSLARILDCVWLGRRDPRRLSPARRRAFVVLLALDGLLWGAAGLLFVGDGRPPLGLIVLAGLAVIAAVSLYSLASHFQAAVLFFSAILIPNALYLFVVGSPGALIGGAALLVLEAVLVMESHGLEVRLIEMLRLRHEITLIAADKQRALMLAEHSSQAKTRFLDTLSHELRTPLNGVLGMTQLLAAEALTPPQQASLAAIVKSARQLERVIGDLLDQSGVEHGRMTISAVPMSLRDVLQEVVAVVGPLVEQAGLRFEFSDTSRAPEWITSDPVRIKQILHNLVSNAIKFTRQGTISLAVAGDDARIVVSVSDTGVGIATSQIERMFDAFEHGMQRPGAAPPSGTGLGLTISRAFARALGGDLICSSMPGRGSTFEFSLPVRAVEAPRPPEPAPALEPGSALGCVLLVEDDPVNAVVAQTILERAGFDVETAFDGQAAVDALERGRCDVVLMDCQLPVFSGWEATRVWRERERARNVARRPIIALTANAIDGDRERCLAAGMDDYLSKPVDAAALVSAVRRHMPRSRAPR